MHRFITIYSTILPHKILFCTNKFRKPKIIHHTRSIKHQTKQRKRAVNARTIGIYEAEFNKTGQTTLYLFKTDTKYKKPLCTYLFKKKKKKKPYKKIKKNTLFY